MIISASRRTDIPSFYGEWFMNALKRGYVYVPNPYRNGYYSKVCLDKTSADVIVFWTKNPIPFMKYLDGINDMGYPYIFNFTITAYGNECEANLPDKDILMNTFKDISKKIGKSKMIWRYDPIIIDDMYTVKYHAEKFTAMATKLSEYCDRCVISFVDTYTSVSYKGFKNISNEKINQVSELISNIAKSNNLKVYTCSEIVNLDKFGILHGSCIDKDMIENALNCKINIKPEKNQRKECQCLESLDIGTYNSCLNGCGYCYAVRSHKSAMSNMSRHNPNSPVLIGELDENAIITERDNNSIKVNQISFF